MIKGFFMLALAALLLTCCGTYKREHKQEHALVLETVYQPGAHATDLTPAIGLDGKVAFAIVDIDIPDRWAVVFKCQHGKFVIQGEQRKHQKLWQELQRGDQVIVDYDEVVYCPRGDNRNRCTLENYDFLGAIKISGPTAEAKE